jgi:hypothetical protein
MTKFEDANFLYEAGTKAIKPSPYKYGTQLFEMNHCLKRQSSNGLSRREPMSRNRA